MDLIDCLPFDSMPPLNWHAHHFQLVHAANFSASLSLVLAAHHPVFAAIDSNPVYASRVLALAESHGSWQHSHASNHQPNEPYWLSHARTKGGDCKFHFVRCSTFPPMHTSHEKKTALAHTHSREGNNVAIMFPYNQILSNSQVCACRLFICAAQHCKWVGFSVAEAVCCCCCKRARGPNMEMYH